MPSCHGLLGLDDAAGEREFGRALITEQPLQEPRAAVAGDDAQVDEGFAERRVGRADADVAHVGEIEAARRSPDR